MKGKDFLKKLFSVVAASSALMGAGPTIKSQASESHDSISSPEANGVVPKLVFARSSSGIISSSWHRSHSSHASHNSHASHYSHYSSYNFEPVKKV